MKLLLMLSASLFAADGDRADSRGDMIRILQLPALHQTLASDETLNLEGIKTGPAFPCAPNGIRTYRLELTRVVGTMLERCTVAAVVDGCGGGNSASINPLIPEECVVEEDLFQPLPQARR